MFSHTHPFLPWIHEHPGLSILFPTKNHTLESSNFYPTIEVVKTKGDHMQEDLRNTDQPPHPASRVEELIQEIAGVPLRARSLSLLLLSLAWRDLNSRILWLPMLPWPSGILVLDSQVWNIKSMHYRRWALERNILLKRKEEIRILCSKSKSPWEWDGIKCHHLGVNKAFLHGSMVGGWVSQSVRFLA